ncbi:uncharacterized protein LOC104428710 [Eucalyptus grandis]|uniref:uncharacterized protein LOC104428710 n=1 Tax=Eucalyptus grandis TaxID=71139 RepID=UPI00192EA6A8|nr:uncharacterized protein LOC104428710 [Eucalyptus grandis]
MTRRPSLPPSPAFVVTDEVATTGKFRKENIMLSSERRRRLSLYLSLRRRRLGTAGEVEAEFSSRRVARKGERMSSMKGLAKAEPVWLKAMQQSVNFYLLFAPLPCTFHNAVMASLMLEVEGTCLFCESLNLCQSGCFRAPPALFPRADEIKQIALPEDVYVKKFFQKYLDSKHEDAIKICGFDPPSAFVFGQGVLELKESGVSVEEAMAVADMEYRLEKKAKQQAYA